MKVLFATCSLVLALIASSCDESTGVEYWKQGSVHISPDSVVSNTNRELKLALAVQTPSRGCWSLDKPIFGKDTDRIMGVNFTSVGVSIQHPVNAVCAAGLDTLHTPIAIKFDTSGTVYVEFPQVDAMGNFFNKRVSYIVKD